eukprot:3584428-Pyramimonas_sp.AAC.1
MDVGKRAKYYLLTRINGERQRQHADSCVLDIPTTRGYMHARTISVFGRRRPSREHPERGLAHHM